MCIEMPHTVTRQGKCSAVTGVTCMHMELHVQSSVDKMVMMAACAFPSLKATESCIECCKAQAWICTSLSQRLVTSASAHVNYVSLE